MFQYVWSVDGGMFAPRFPLQHPQEIKPHGSHVFFLTCPVTLLPPSNGKHRAPVPLDDDHPIIAVAGILLYHRQVTARIALYSSSSGKRPHCCYRRDIIPRGGYNTDLYSSAKSKQAVTNHIQSITACP